jgi:hypothetical protein
MLVGLARHAQLGHDRLNGLAIGGHQMDPGDQMALGASERLAVEGQHAPIQVGDAVGLDPAPQGVLEGRGIEPGQDSVQLACAGGAIAAGRLGAEAPEADQWGQIVEIAAPQGDRQETATPTEQRSGDEGEDSGQRLDGAAGVARIGDSGQGRVERLIRE